ncbi:hypothetical protein Efla_000841 [Eimeria flavescens]
MFDVPGIVSKGAFSPLLTSVRSPPAAAAAAAACISTPASALTASAAAATASGLAALRQEQGVRVAVAVADELKSYLGLGPLHSSSLRLEGGGRGALWLGGLCCLRNEGPAAVFITPMLSRRLPVLIQSKSKPQQQQQQHGGEETVPPVPPPAFRDRVASLGPLRRCAFEVKGKGWKESACDVVLGDLGWVALTGAGDLKLAVYLPETVTCRVRLETLIPQPLLLCPALDGVSWSRRFFNSTSKGQKQQQHQQQRQQRQREKKDARRSGS